MTYTVSSVTMNCSISYLQVFIYTCTFYQQLQLVCKVSCDGCSITVIVKLLCRPGSPMNAIAVSRLSHSENRYYDKMLLKQERLNETVRRRLNFDIKASSSAIVFELQPVHCARGRTNSRGPNVLRPRVDILLICAMNIHH